MTIKNASNINLFLVNVVGSSQPRPVGACRASDYNQTFFYIIQFRASSLLN